MPLANDQNIILPESPAKISRELINELITRRKKQWEWAGKSIQNQQIALEMCKRDLLLWANTWVWVYDPRNIKDRPATIPLILFPKQEEFLIWLSDRRNKKESGLVEKCRDSGATYLACIYAIHGWLFETGFKATFGSRKEDLVDKSDDPDSIFEKIRMILKYLPPWMMPKGYERIKHDKFMRIKNPVNGSTITGESGDNMGRGGRSSIYFKDEAAYLMHPDKVEAAVSGTCDTVIDISTPQGMGNPFARKRHSGKVNVFKFAWTDDPRKSVIWYRRKKASLESSVFAQEIEIDYSSSVENVLIQGDWIKAACDWNIPESYLNYIKSNRKIGALDIADSGSNKNVYIDRQGIVLNTLLSWSNTNTTETAYRAIAIGNRENIDFLYYDRPGVGAGVAGILESQITDEYNREKKDDNLARFEFEGYNGGARCSDTVWEVFGDKKSYEIFANLKAESCWLLRTRFEKTYEFVVKGIHHEIEELIYISTQGLKAKNNLQSQVYYLSEELNQDIYLESQDVDNLLSELSQPKYFHKDNGQIRMETKREMKNRGVKSPDYFDTLFMVFNGEEVFDPLDAMNSDD